VTTGPAEIFDLGYRGYEGARTGRWQRRRAIWRDGVRISLGLGRGAGAKIAPWLLLGFALVPVLILIVIAALAGSSGESTDDALPSYAEYYEIAHVPIILFAAIVAPLLLCPDRRDGVLSLYAARPISAADYVGSRWAAFLAVSLAAVWLPQAILFAWNLLDATDAGSFLADEWDIVPRFLAAGGVMALVLTTLSLLCASLVSRRAHAAVAILAIVFVGSAIGGIVEENFTGTLSDLVSLVGLPQSLIQSVHWILADPLEDRPYAGWVPTLWLVALSAVLLAALLLRTRKVMRT
jgi:ABC-2 type transport system permease protein